MVRSEEFLNKIPPRVGGGSLSCWKLNDEQGTERPHNLVIVVVVVVVAAGAGRHVAAGAGRHVAPGAGRHVAPGPGRCVNSTLKVR